MARDLVTGAFGYTGSRIAERLMARGRAVATLTRRPSGSHQLEARVERLPYDFSEAALAPALAGIDTVYVTYWMRFPRGDATWDQVVDNVGRLARASAAAGVRRLIYISVSNARNDSSTAYFRAKARAEAAVHAAATEANAASLPLTYAIVRPTLLFGPADILINNMAWALRRLPVFGIAGDGKYGVQPVHVDDVADLCMDLAAGGDRADVTAAGPETFEFNELVRIVRAAVRSRAVVLHMPGPIVLATARLLGVLVRDVVLTRDEMRELTESLLVSTDAPTAPTRFSEWVAAHGDEIGRRYSSELGRNFRFERR